MDLSKATIIESTHGLLTVSPTPCRQSLETSQLPPRSHMLSNVSSKLLKKYESPHLCVH